MSNFSPLQENGWTSLDIANMRIRNLSPSLFNYRFLTHLYLNGNHLESLPPAISSLTELQVLNLSSNRLTSLPAEIGMCINLTELLLFDNRLVDLPEEFGNLYCLDALGLDGNPIVDPFMTLVHTEGAKGVVMWLRDSSPAPHPPPERAWLPFENDISAGKNKTYVDTFSIYCHNILCERYTSSVYGYVPSWALDWKYRRNLIVQDILSCNPDIVCLQEIAADQFEDYFLEYLMRMGGYQGTFKPKSRSRTMSLEERKLVDGCAIFFKANRFSFVDEHLIEFNQVALNNLKFPKSDNTLNRIMIKDNIAVISLLCVNEPPPEASSNLLIVVNVHIHWDPQFSDVKIMQTAMLLEELDDFMAKRNLSKESVPILLCGDFNSLPESAVYEFVCTKKIKAEHSEFLGYQYPCVAEGGMQHKFSLKSAYVEGEKELMPFTNYTPKFKGVIDYIFYNPSLLSTTGVFGPLDKGYMKKVVGFPNAHCPSE